MSAKFFNTLLQILVIAIPIILILTFIYGGKFRRWIDSLQKTKAVHKLEKIREETWDKIWKRQEIKQIEKENAGVLKNIKIFLGNNGLSVDNKFLRESVVSEFNRNVQEDERIPLDLPDKKLRKAVKEKAEEYYAIGSPLLKILEESFINSACRDLEK